MENRIALLKCLADESRIAILNILAKGDSYVEMIASKLELTPATVCYHLKKMEAAGIVCCSRTQFYMIYSLNREMFDCSLAELLFTGDQTIDREDAYRQKILDSFIVNGRLLSIPSQRKKREIVLDKLAERFEFDRTYTEREVNQIILEFHDDFCTVRRWMIEYGLMIRDREIYQRVKK